MATQLQLRKGTKVQNDMFTGAEAELTYDSTSKGLRLHDGTKQGGYMIDTVVDFQMPTAENNYTWYRKYASGWVEQGARYAVTTSSPHTMTLPVTMANTYYTIMLTPGMATTGDATVQVHVRTDMITTTSFGIQKQWTSDSGFYYWRVEGMAA